MVFTPVISDRQLKKEDRRSHPRRRCEQLDYTDFGPDNGGILLDLSEGGLGFQGVEAVTEGQLIHLKFTLPGASTNIKADARVARTNDSRKGGGLRFVDLSEDVRQRVRAWVTGEITGARPSGTFVTGADRRPSFGAINPPELSTADSAAMEQACALVAARISGVPDVKPDEAATPTLSSAEHGAGDESLGTTAPPDIVATTPDVVGINQASIDHGTADRVQGLPEPLKPLLPPEPLPPPEQAATEKASASPPDLWAPESLRVSLPAPGPAPAAAVAPTHPREPPRQAPLSTHSAGPQKPATH